MYMWATAHLSELSENPPHRVLSAKDYIAYWLTGEYITDPSTASGYGIYSLSESDWDAALCDKIGFERSVLPGIKPSTDIVGTLKKDIAALLGLEAGVPVINGCADSVCGALSMGAYKEGTLCQIWGTSTALLAMTDKYKMSPTGKYFITPMAMEGTYGYEADLLSTGVSVKWFKELVGGRSRDISFYGAKTDAGSDGLLFYPYLSGGEQGVLWEPELRGGLLGLSEKHTIAHIARAIQESICFEVKRCLAAFSAGGFRAKRILCTGPASADAFFMQMMADILDLSCTVSANTQGSSSGAAWLAGAAAGFWTLEDESNAAKNRSAVYTPSKESGIYPGVYKKYLANTDKMKINSRKNK
jgi:xylulokinase